MNFTRITRKPTFWIFQVFVFLVCSGLAVHLYPRAFPVVDLQIKMDRATALKSAAALSIQHHWSPGKFQQAARFELDEEAQTFIELTGGGSRAFAKVLQEELYYPYTWKVRNYAEGNTSETVIHFTPKGDFYAFHEKLSENDSGAALKAPQAQLIAEEAAKNLGVKLSEYELVEKSQEIKPSHRVDHSFVYERPHLKFGNGQYRLILVVAGDRLVKLSHFIKIPDAFLRHYAEMRSSNDTIAVASTTAIAILYFLGGCVLGLFLLSKRHWVTWRWPLFAALVVGGFQFLEQLNHLPLIWMEYDTALSSGGFLARHIFSSLALLVFEVIMLTVSFAAAESLSRRAFPHHPQLWSLWSTRNASTFNILGRTLGGYLALGFFFFYVVVIYLFGTHYLGWWSPSDTLFHPDVLATYFPWFTSISNSLHAGFWEESLFRAVPLACAALLGNRFGGRKKWILLGLVLQAIVFASAHANYPAQPSYARVVELLFPSFIFGGLFLAFGLLPGIILHFIFDTVSFAIPLFAAETPGIWIQRGMVILFAFIPLWIVLIARLKTRQWSWLPPFAFNGAWKPEVRSLKKTLTEDSIEGSGEAKVDLGRMPISPLSGRFILLLSSLALVFWLFFFHFENQALRLDIGREKAIKIARNALVQSGFNLSPAWNVGAFITEGSDQEEDFIWKTGGVENYRKLLGSYLPPSGWFVRFFRFDTDVAERAEEFQVFVYSSGAVYRIRHEIPEGRAIPSLTEEGARKVALDVLQRTYGIDPSQLGELSSTAAKLPARTDWSFVFSNTTISLPSGEARVAVRVAGDSVAAIRRFVFIPESWSREERNRQNSVGIVKGISALLVALIMLAGVGISLKKWVQHAASYKSFWFSFGFFFLVNSINFINVLPVRLAQFSTEGPRLNQFVTLFSLSFIKIIFVSGSLGLVLGNILQFLRRHPRLKDLTSIRVGYSIGILGTVLLAGISRLLPPLGPVTGKLDALNSFIPRLYGFQTVVNYTVVTLFALLIGSALQVYTRGWKLNRVWAACSIILLGFIIAGLQAETLIHWGVMGLSTGLVLLAVYQFILKSTLNLIPLATAGVFVLAVLKELNLNAYVGNLWDLGVSLVLVVATSVVFVVFLIPPGSVKNSGLN
jgi:hypothetical protein